MADTAKIHGDKLPGLNLLLRGHAVGEAAVGAGDYDGIKGHVLCTVVEHQILEPGGDLPLCHAGANLLQNVLQRPLGDARGGGHDLQLLPALYPAQLQQQVRGGHQLTGQGFAVCLELLDGHITVFKAHFLNGLLLNGLFQPGGVTCSAPHLPQFRVPEGPSGGFGIAGVGEVIVFVPGDQSHAVGAGGVEAGGVEAVGLAGEKHGVETVGLQPGGDILKVIHVRVPPSWRIGIKMSGRGFFGLGRENAPVTSGGEPFGKSGIWRPEGGSAPQ